MTIKSKRVVRVFQDEKSADRHAWECRNVLADSHVRQYKRSTSVESIRVTLYVVASTPAPVEV
jgi:hypothetical protein